MVAPLLVYLCGPINYAAVCGFFCWAVVVVSTPLPGSSAKALNVKLYSLPRVMPVPASTGLISA